MLGLLLLYVALISWNVDENDLQTENSVSMDTNTLFASLNYFLPILDTFHYFIWKIFDHFLL